VTERAPSEHGTEVDRIASGIKEDPKTRDDGEDRLSGGEEEDQEDDKVPDTTPSQPRRDLWAEAWQSDEVGEERRSLLQEK
jgi:hypothetical protein